MLQSSLGAQASSGEALSRLERYLVSREARHIVSRLGSSRLEILDVEQQLIADYLSRQAEFEPARGQHTAFFRTVIHRLALNLARRELAQKRGAMRQVRLDEVHLHTLAQRGSHPEASDLKLDVDAAVDQLPPHLKRLAQRLKTHSLMEVAREIGVPHSTLSGWMRKIRVAFERASLQEYL
jgi:RNA polymerase sigma factor (sigma-70 family)